MSGWLKVLAVALVCSPLMAQAEQKIDDAKKAAPKKVARDTVEVTLESTVTGNQEQPKVLYIVPWQAPDGPESFKKGFQSDLDELFQPIEREEFLRQLKVRQLKVRQRSRVDDITKK